MQRGQFTGISEYHQTLPPGRNAELNNGAPDTGTNLQDTTTPQAGLQITLFEELGPESD